MDDLHEIKDRQGWHYEEVDKDDKDGVGKGDNQSQQRQSID